MQLMLPGHFITNIYSMPSSMLTDFSDMPTARDCLAWLVDRQTEEAVKILG